MQRVGFIGIGRMGRWMAQHLLSNGYKVTVYDVVGDATRELAEIGARVAATVAEVGRDCETVITMLPNSQAVEAVLLGNGGLLESMQPGGTIIDMSSSYCLSTKRLAAEAQAKGVTLLDAPVSGGVKGAQGATLTIMVGGSQADYENILPILKCMGKTINHIGKTGAGHAVKAINNYLSAASLYATTEAMILAKAMDIDLGIALDTINQSSGQSYSTHYKFPTFVLPRSFNSGFSLELLLKDVKMVSAMARDTGIPVLLAGAVEQIYTAAQSCAEEQQDHTEIVKFLENIAKISLTEEVKG
ncbi:MAG TPA: NAD(P)-dependent oxidoreductase [Verrucomicrobiae bacterium]|nr:NAD(P)-dependent oxidoreductase [Verrucomicrobiae bacterium]